MIKITITEFERYKDICDKVLDLLIEENHSSLKDISIIYNIIMGFPYCLNTEGQYTYDGKLYNSLQELPHEALVYCLHYN